MLGPRLIQRCCNGKTVGLPFSSGTSSGIASRLTSPNGTRTYSAWPPAKPPVKCEYPKMPAVLPPYMALVMVLELVISHWDESFCLQKKHWTGLSAKKPRGGKAEGAYISAGNLERDDISLPNLNALD